MERFKMFSGQELLDKGVTKLEATLPQTSVHKNITPNGSWLEQKQIQSALEDRKLLIGAQRIEKCGALSHAKWLEDIKLAEVTQPCSGIYQFLGHTKDKKLYLKPEEALFLMEVNSLLLTYDEITVSLQQAYTLLLRDIMPIYKYKVYASLSRLGYKVFQHVYSVGIVKQENNDISQNNEMSVDNCDHSSKDIETEDIHLNNIKKSQEVIQLSDDTEHEINEKNTANEKGITSTSNCTEINSDSKETEISINIENLECIEANTDKISELKSAETYSKDQIFETSNKESHIDPSAHTSIIGEKDPLTKFNEWKLRKLKSRRITGTKIDLHKIFENIPDLSDRQIVTINVPKEEHLPKNIFLNNLTYVLNIENVTSKITGPQCMNSRTYSISDEVNGDHIRRVTSSNTTTTTYRTQNVGIPSFYQNVRQNISYRQFMHWRPRPTLNYFQFNLFFQRHFMQGFNMPRFQFYPRTHLSMFPRYFINSTNSNERGLPPPPRREDTAVRKRKRSTAKKHHFDSLKNLANLLRHLISAGGIQTQNMEALQKLIETYNLRYSTRLRLTEDLEITNDETIIETIELDDDEEVHRKKRRIDNANHLQDVHLNRIREISRTLKHLEDEGKATARHRRAFSSLIKTFNRSYNADIYANDNNEISDKRSITLDSSSDSECILEESPKLVCGKKLRNPFNILKRLSEKNKSGSVPTTSKQENRAGETKDTTKVENSITGLEKIFRNGWLPNADDFGKPEIVKKDNMDIRITDSKKEDFLYEFLKGKPHKFNNWVEAKIEFLENIEKTNAIFRSEAMKVDHNNIEIKSIIKSEDCTDMSTVLKKLSIIKNNNNTCNESSLVVDFDVYNRDVQNFRKVNKPLPHFRIICLDDSKPCPTGSEIATLHSKYSDDVMLVFAIVGNASISYLQIYPTNLSVFSSSNDVE